LAAEGLALAAFALFAVSCLQRFRAGSTNVAPFNSDTAIHVLMANDPHWDPFQFFYYGQDRIGGWPFLALRLLGKLSGTVWTWPGVHLCMCLWILGGALALGRLYRPCWAAAALAYSWLLTQVSGIQSVIFEGHVYAWQIPTLLLAWLSLRLTLSERYARASGAPIRVDWTLLLSTLACFAASWMSSISGPILVFLAVIEVCRIGALSPGGLAAPLRLRLVRALSPVLLGALFEVALRHIYHVYASRRFGHDFRTSLRVEWGRLASNTRAVLSLLLGFETKWVWLLGLVSTLVALLLVARMTRRPKTRTSESDASGMEGLFFILGAGCIALVQLPLLSSLSHVRANDFEYRYFVIVEWFGCVAGLLGLAAVVARWLRLGPTALLALSAVGFAVLTSRLPPYRADPDYAQLRRTGQELARRRPGSVLLSGYWDAYLLAGVEPGRLIPVPFEGEYLRIPANLAALRSAGEVVVGHQGFGDAVDPTLMGNPLKQYGATLRLVTADFYHDEHGRYSLYQRVYEDIGGSSSSRETQQ
jgi:hypothetical protein